MNPNNRKQLLIIVAAVMVGLWVADKMIFTPLTNQWKRRSEEITALRKTIEQNKNKVALLSNIQFGWVKDRKRVLPKTASEAEQLFFDSLEKWAKETNVSVTSVKPQWKAGATDDYSLLECRVDTSGSLDTLARFIDKIEHSPMALKVESLEVSKQDNNGQQMALVMNLSGLRLAELERK